MSTTLDLPNGAKATIVPFNTQKIREALKSLASRGVRVNMGDSDLLNSIEFQVASGRVVVKNYEAKQDDGTYKGLSDGERFKFLEEHPKITNYLVKEAQKLAASEDSEFEEESKN